MPFELGSVAAALAALATGFGFGFALERGGLADARRLAAQFYFTDVRVLKVMFTAIVVAMLGVYGLAGVGLVDLERIFVNPTNLWPGIVGGLLLGGGFIIGGYCPGTSLLAAVNLKLDAIAFVVGVLVGIFAFGETVALFADWYQNAGAYGRLTLPALLDWDAPLLVVAVVVMALAAFWAGERAEDHFGPASERGAERHLRRLAPALLGGALLVVIAGPPSAEARLRWQEPELEARLAERAVHLDPGEVVELMHNRQVPLRIVDVRDEAAFNLFHLRDARRWSLADLARAPLDLRRDALVVVTAHDEARAEQAWALLQVRGYRNAYVLAGGIDGWLELFRAERTPLRQALGSRWPASSPPLEATRGRSFERKAKVVGPTALAGGGCG